MPRPSQSPAASVQVVLIFTLGSQSGLKKCPTRLARESRFQQNMHAAQGKAISGRNLSYPCALQRQKDPGACHSSRWEPPRREGPERQPRPWYARTACSFVGAVPAQVPRSCSNFTQSGLLTGRQPCDLCNCVCAWLNHAHGDGISGPCAVPFLR
ncbi:uncharacterized protein B0I36DRAFT_331648 [Microdochium trichocladiopsis]|uniref:Uncharacterized protein n=1 Tax=Microdochium trichocladiopsis TaxID=1682393 RepID=A0A9P9BIT4_9PEZI|nr:uncharacterized protein B0I36DRAFT_331648 [Microdochium trichocladiopsis]KAH7024578.1 hypothetical protein B0I36DRAFT_331648 [Microdochium trichocladiopsis]